MDESNMSPLPPKLPEVITFNFPNALQQVIEGKRIRRIEWEDTTEQGLLHNGWLTIYRNGKFNIWQVSDGDMLAEDWIIIEEN